MTTAQKRAWPKGYAFGSAMIITALAILSPTIGFSAEVTIDTNVRYQTIEGWGSCLVTWDQSIPYYSTAWREAYRDLGCNIVRMPMTKSVLVAPDGNYATPVELVDDLQTNINKMDFDVYAVELFADLTAWLRQNAFEPNEVRLEGSVWSPPHWMKGPTGAEQYHVSNPSLLKPTPWLSGCGGTCGDSIGGRLLQDADNLEQFGRYMAAWVEGFEQYYGIPVYVVSLQNEVSFENPFDSCTYLYGYGDPDPISGQYWQYASALKALKDEFEQKNVGVKIHGPHMATLGSSPAVPWALNDQMYFIQAVKDHSDSTLVDFLDFYGSNGYQPNDEDGVKCWAAYWLGKNNVPASWAAWTFCPGIGGDGKGVWFAECGGPQSAWLNGGGGTTPGDGAICVAQKMHSALVHANASSYIYWQMTDGSWDETEHTLLGESHISNPHDSKKYCAYKHFSRYIRPGAQRVKATFANGKTSTGGASEYDTYNSLDVSAFVRDANGTLAIVLVNMKSSDYSVTINVPATPDVETFSVFRTKSDEGFDQLSDLTVTGEQVSLTVPAYSVVTLYGIGAGMAPPGAPSNPTPPDTATDVRIDTQLSWTAGAGATSHDVYFGTTDPPPFVTNQTETTYQPGTLGNNKTYYWKINERNDYGTAGGPVWDFHTETAEPPELATNPNPARSATGISRTTNLSWDAGAGTYWHEFYFGTNPMFGPEVYQGSLSTTGFDPGILEPSTTYYWRVDEVNPYGTTTGWAWFFTTNSAEVLIEFDSSNSNYESTPGATLSFEHTIGTGDERAVVVGVAGEDANEADLMITSVIYNGVRMRRIADSAAVAGTSTLQKTELFYLLENALPAPGSYIVTVTFAGDVDYRCAGAVSLRHVYQGPPEAVTTNTESSSQTIATDITTLTDGAWVVDVVSSGQTGSFTKTTADMVERWDTATTGSTAAAATEYVQTAGLATMSWEHTSTGQMTHSIAVFAPADAYYPLGDLNLDRRVNNKDAGIFAGQWLDSGDCSAEPDCADLDDSNDVDFEDFGLLGGNWGL